MPLRAQAAQVDPEATNLHVYRDPEVVSHYACLDYLTASERLLFDAYLKPGMAILDLGVGGGRTTSYLSRKASRYVGVDYSEEMIRLCRNKFPQLAFLVADASDLSRFSDGSFDAIVFAFNGLDYVLPGEKRRQCLKECHRLLKAGGVFTFSSHNPCAVLVRPSWDRQRLRAVASIVASPPGVLFTATLGGLTAAKSVHVLFRAFAGSVMRVFRRVPTIAFWRGEGCVMDSAHGGLMTHCCTPTHAIAETSTFGFRLERVLGNDYPRRSHQLLTDWYYYVFSKAEKTRSETCG
jgi:SAM-dependent methyltransferase